jgi:UrcA family protein
MIHRIPRSGLALIASATAFCVAARDSREPVRVQVVVPYGDLNLGSSSGSQALALRIERAAQRACADIIHGVQELDSHLPVPGLPRKRVEAAIRSLPAATASAIRTSSAARRVAER